MAEFGADMKRFLRAMPRMIADAVEQTMVEAEGQAKQTTAFVDRTTNLRNSIKGGLTKATRNEVIGALTATMDYAGYIELGTSRMSPRPYIQPAVEYVVLGGVFEMALRSRIGRFQ